jgi:hypothetical protein
LSQFLSEEKIHTEVVATPRSLSLVPGEDGIFHVNPITISSTPASFTIIQPIHIVSPGTQSTTIHNQTPRPFLKTNPLPSLTKLPRFPKQQPLSLSFEDEPSIAVLGRQVAGQPVDGFPNGLPALTPLGVRITLENMFGMDSW